MVGISSKSAGNVESKKRFQGQEFSHNEFTDGSGLEMYEFKYRMDDPQTGRFWQIDPLSNKYVYNSTYAFSENKVTGHVELEGLEAVVTEDKRQGTANQIPNWGIPSYLPMSPTNSPSPLLGSSSKTTKDKKGEESKSKKQAPKPGFSFTATFTFGAQAQFDYDGIGIGGGIAVDLLGVRDNKGVGFAHVEGEDFSTVRKFGEASVPVLGSTGMSYEKTEKRQNYKVVKTSEKISVSILGILHINSEKDNSTGLRTDWISLGASIKGSFIIGGEAGFDIPLYIFPNTQKK